ncbi:ATP-dependent permease, partial [Cryomyces antarcticus]
MEAVKGSHFETFLSEDQQSNREPDESLKHKSSQSSMLRSLSVDSVVPSLHHTVLPQDSLEIHLDGKETVRRSFVPTIYGNSASARIPYLLTGQMSPMVTPYRSNISPTYNSPASRLSSRDDLRISTSSKRTSQMSNRWSLAGTELMEKFMEKTGNLAMESRSNPLNVRRRRPKSAASGRTLELAKPSAKMRRIRKRPQSKNQAPLEGPQNETLKNILSTIWPSLTWGSKTLLIVGFAGAFVHAVATPLFSWIFSKLLATFFVAEGRKHLATVYSLCVLGIAIGDATGSYLMHILLEYVGSCWIDGIRKEAMKRILDQPRHFFDQEENNVSRLNESLDRHAEEMRNLLGRFAAFIFIA